jgi:hypothetical protein
MGSVRALVALAVDPAPSTDPSLRPSFPGVQIGVVIFDGPLQALNELQV